MRFPAITAIATAVLLTACMPAGASTPTAQTFNGTPTVGALFEPASPLIHTCTASVVDSKAGNLLITAAHCISGTGAGYTFAPGYHNRSRPYGTYKVLRAYAAASWTSGQSPQSDYAFLVLAARDSDPQHREVQSLTGANRLGMAPASGTRVTVIGYDLGIGDRPITCNPSVYYREAGNFSYPAFNCNPYKGGTSGSPWLQHTRDGWAVTAVIGGLHQGGCTTSTSYSSNFGQEVAQTQARAVAGGAGSVFPQAGSDGC